MVRSIIYQHPVPSECISQLTAQMIMLIIKFQTYAAQGFMVGAILTPLWIPEPITSTSQLALPTACSTSCGDVRNIIHMYDRTSC